MPTNFVSFYFTVIVLFVIGRLQLISIIFAVWFRQETAIEFESESYLSHFAFKEPRGFSKEYMKTHPRKDSELFCRLK